MFDVYVYQNISMFYHPFNTGEMAKLHSCIFGGINSMSTMSKTIQHLPNWVCQPRYQLVKIEWFTLGLVN